MSATHLSGPLIVGGIQLVDSAGDVTVGGTLVVTGSSTVQGVVIDTGTKTATATAGAATLNKLSGRVTSEALTTAAGADYTLTLTNSAIAAADHVLVSVGSGTNTTVGLALDGVKAAAGSVVILVRNTHATAALNGTILVDFVVIKA